MNPTRPPALVCGEPADLTAAAASLAESGWVSRAGFSLPEEPWDLTRRRWVCEGTVDDNTDAEAATWALVRGCAVVVAVGGGAPPDFVADLARAGQVLTWAPAHSDVAGLGTVESDLLRLLGDGLSLQQAAGQLYLSGRTAQRRLNSARAALGVRTTREAVLAWTRLTRPPHGKG
ncbi:MAG: hypothetical protein WKF51_09080 [Geodermatophilaceae bacterium]